MRKYLESARLEWLRVFDLGGLRFEFDWSSGWVERGVYTEERRNLGTGTGLYMQRKREVLHRWYVRPRAGPGAGHDFTAAGTSIEGARGDIAAGVTSIWCGSETFCGSAHGFLGAAEKTL
jgi:hypothetical protein